VAFMTIKTELPDIILVGKLRKVRRFKVGKLRRYDR
jgi:hypothetical protein